MEQEIVNKVAESGIIQLDLKDFLPKESFHQIDLKEQLWQGLVVKEKEFRDWIKNHEWSMYKNKNVLLFCSADAIVPAWAYMLVVSNLTDVNSIYFCTPENAVNDYFFDQLSKWEVTSLKDKMVMVKGCSDIPQPEKAYVMLTQKLIPIVKSLMFGEPCSAVPVYKRK